MKTHPTNIFPGNMPDHKMIVRHQAGQARSIALEVEIRGGRYRVRSAHTLRDDQFKERLTAAGPGAMLGVSRVNPKNKALETPSRSLGTPHDVPPAVVLRVYQQT